MSKAVLILLSSLAGLSTLALGQAGCAKHADYVEVREGLRGVAKAQDQALKRQEAMQRRLQSLEAKLDAEPPARPAPAEDGVKQPEGIGQRIVELDDRLKDLEIRLARLEEAQHAQAAPYAGPTKPESASGEGSRQSKPARLPALPESVLPLPGTPDISPTSAFNLAYNDYLKGRYELAINGFHRFLEEFPSTSLAPNAHYWVGEAYYSSKDFVHATQAFEKVVAVYPRSEKVAPALFKLGVIAGESGDTRRARDYLKRVIEEFSTSDEAKLAKHKLAEIR